ncbi:FecR domain-containing protein [Candidimonas nitroreducens]|uniref:Iron dicitrate transport regulator FecR n=1 Tax=Candidimonas nitroreducens TaxID=683354 RepID=A0A225M2W4_9BURK|nr:FecR domain-containing protein [Candidimonas nitroreducens]OWT55658.1 iron dicitrate transport regulator FecR [Candidimonas nitroreducens]
MASPAPPQAIVNAAIDWAVKLQLGTPSAETRAAFDVWLADNALHAVAWDRVQAMFGAMSGMRGGVAVDVLRKLDDERSQRRDRRRSALRRIAALGVISPLAFWIAYEYSPWQRVLADHSTRLGELRSVRLADGTVVDLNSDTAISFSQSNGRRLLTLWRGEIYVRTGHETGAALGPFFVRIPYGLAQALGTRFTVRIEQASSSLFVDEGAIRLLPANGRSLVLSAGQSGWLSDAGAGRSPRPPIDPMGWMDGVISSRSVRLADLLAEVARYRSGRIVCDSRIADRRVSGTFHVGDTDGVLRFLARTQSLQITYYTPLWVHVGPRADGRGGVRQ